MKRFSSFVYWFKSLRKSAINASIANAMIITIPYWIWKYRIRTSETKNVARNTRQSTRATSRPRLYLLSFHRLRNNSGELFLFEIRAIRKGIISNTVTKVVIRLSNTGVSGNCSMMKGCIACVDNRNIAVSNTL